VHRCREETVQISRQEPCLADHSVPNSIVCSESLTEFDLNVHHTGPIDGSTSPEKPLNTPLKPKDMAKNSKKRKHAPEKVASVGKKLKQEPVRPIASDPPANGIVVSDILEVGGMVGGLIYEDELETTTETLLTLSQNPGLIGLKALKPFKTAVHDYWRVAHETTNTGMSPFIRNTDVITESYLGNSLTSRISSALIDQRHVDALVLLAEMVIREQVPKLGALQRWVRECDAVLTPTMSQADENRVWQVLDAILRTTQPEMVAHPTKNDAGALKPGSRLRWYEPFTVTPGLPTNAAAIEADVISAEAAKVLQPLQTTPGSERRPPNKHPAIIWFSPPGSFPLLSSSQRSRQPSRHDIPGVPDAFIINDALEVPECESLIKAAEAVGLIPDEPIAGSAAQLASVLAHNLIWLADSTFIKTLYERIVHLLPQAVHGGAVKGINSRFRLYRYRPGALYRPHVRCILLLNTGSN